MEAFLDLDRPLMDRFLPFFLRELSSKHPDSLVESTKALTSLMRLLDKKWRFRTVGRNIFHLVIRKIINILHQEFSVDPHAHYSRLRSLSPHDWSKGTQIFSGHVLHILEVQEPLQWLRTKKRRFLDLLCYPRHQTELLWWYLSRCLRPDFWHRFLLGLEPKNERKSKKN